MTETAYSSLLPGDTAPWFSQRSAGNPRYVFDTAAGRYLVLCFIGSAADPHAAAALAAARSRPRVFNDATASFFAVSNDPEDERQQRLAESYPGYRLFWDFDGAVARLYGAMAQDAAAQRQVRRRWVVLDPTMRVMAVLPFAEDRSDIAAFLAYIDGLPPPAQACGFPVQAPVLVLPRVFEPALCRRLIELYDAQGGKESGFMREVGGKTVTIQDHAHKRRRDCVVQDRDLVLLLQGRFRRRVVPQIAKAYQYAATRMERYIVSCYAAEDEAHFRAHRDNTTKGTAHRRFAVSVNLNDDFDGGEVSFPEYGPLGFKAPPGGAVVFSCSLLHAVSRVTRGRRYAFLPFVYDEEAAKIREANNAFLGDNEPAYKPADAKLQDAR